MELAVFLTRKPYAFRLISTARIALAELCARGQFREDLAAVLSTITIVLPPLAERREDLPILAQVFLEECNARGGKQVSGFTHAALDQLYSYSWPGNLDELMEMVVQAHKHASGHEIGVDDLPERLRLAASAAAYPRRPEERIVLDEYLGRVERELIRRATEPIERKQSQSRPAAGFNPAPALSPHGAIGPGRETKRRRNSSAIQS